MGNIPRYLGCMLTAAGTILFSVYISYFVPVCCLAIPSPSVNVNTDVNSLLDIYPRSWVSIPKGRAVVRRQTKSCEIDWFCQFQASFPNTTRMNFPKSRKQRKEKHSHSHMAFHLMIILLNERLAGPNYGH